MPPFAVELVDGVAEHLPEIDLLLEEHAEGWTVARMTALDRTILRVAVEELLYRGRAAVGGDQRGGGGGRRSCRPTSRGAFVNGVLGRIARELDRSRAAADRRALPA